MGKEKIVVNGTSLPEKIGKHVTEKKAEEKDEVKEKDEGGRDGEKVETYKMDVDQEGKETKQEEEKEEKDGKEEDKKEETNSEADGEEEKAEESIKEKGSKKHGKRKSAGKIVNNKKKEEKEREKNEEPKTPMVSAIERPVRKRKSVERLVVSIEKEAVKEFNIEKGRGTELKDIPNVAYKLSRKKTDDTLKLLHTILLGRRGKAFQVKNNISQFSGFVWNQNEEKQMIKVKEKFDKCVKEKLLEFCDVLDIPIAKANIRKEDIVMKLIDFLVAPHATTNELLVDKEQTRKGKKRRRVVKESASLSGNTESQSSAKRRRKIESISTREVKKSTPEAAGELEEENNVNIIPERTKDEMHEHSDSKVKENESEDDSQESRKQKRGSKKLSANKKSAGKAKNKKITTPKKASPLPKRTPTNSSSRAKNVKITTPKKASPLPERTPTNSSSSRSKVDRSTDTSSKKLSRKKKIEEVVKEKTLTPKRSATKDKNGKKIAKGKDKPKEDKRRPSEDELKNAVCQILKEVDFNTVTFTDILKQLAGRFNTDLTPRKSSIKLMIQDELAKLAKEADDEEEEGNVEKEETRPSSQGVEA